MKIKEWFEKVAYKKYDKEFGECWYSKFDDSYITCVGMEKNVKHLAEREITDELTHGVGFSPKDNKWYGWSHRAIYGFGVGSTCSIGDCHYVGSSLIEQEYAAIDFWESDDHENIRCMGIVEEDGGKFFDIRWEYKDTVRNKSLHNTSGGSLHYITPLGKGEWIAKTLDDAKKMAIDFNDGVS